MADKNRALLTKKLYKEFHHLSNRVLSVALALEMQALQEECSMDDIAALQAEVQLVIEALRQCRNTTMEIVGPLPEQFSYDEDAAILSPNQ